MSRCPVCGKKVKDGEAHCPNCGTNLYAENGETVLKSAIKKIRVQRVHIDRKNMIVISIIVVMAILLGGYKIYFQSYQDESSMISELMVENYTFKKKVAAIDAKAESVKNIIRTNLTITETGNELGKVTNSQNNLLYTGTYTLENGNTISYSYSADHNASRCNLSIVYSYTMDSLDQFENSVHDLDSTIVEIGNVVLSTPISIEEYDEAFLNYVAKYKAGSIDEENNVFYVGTCYAFMNVDMNEEGKYVVGMEFTYDPCEVAY